MESYSLAPLLYSPKLKAKASARDAQGNVMATYEETFETVSGNKRRSNFTLAHHDIYGSKRLGTDNAGQALVTEFNASIHGTTGAYQHIDEVVYSELNKGELTQLMTAPEEEVVFIPYSGVDKTVRHIAGSENGITMSGTGITVTEGAYNISGSDIVVGAGEVIEFESTDTVRISNEGSSLILSSTENSEAGGRGGISKGKVNDLPFNTGTNAGGGTTWPYYNMVVVTEHERAADEKRYELTNHLGNVLLTLNDRKIAEGSAGGETFDYYTADVLSYADYYPFGSLLPNRNGGESGYKYGFNGMEMDDEIKSITGSSYDFGARIYDPRVGRWLSTDPAAAKYPGQSPYNYALGNPIYFIDPDGEDAQVAVKQLDNGVTQITISSTIRVSAETTDETIAAMNAQFAKYLNGKYDLEITEGENAGKYEIVFDVNVERYTNESDDLAPGENEFVPGSTRGAAHTSGEVTNINPETGEADILMKVSNKADVNSSEGSSSGPHEFLHLNGLADRYTELVGVTVPHEGFNKDVMAEAESKLTNTKQLEGVVNTILSDMKLQPGQSGVLDGKFQVLNKNVQGAGKKDSGSTFKRIEKKID